MSTVINVLDTQSANMIAAGEVVERPASAVKELVENAIDAGARTISVEIRGGGSELLRVSDDGCGISAEDLPRSVLRHATSKIRCGTDIDGVMTLGFRGEALAAIAAVSRLQIISRQSGDDFGSLLTCEEGRTTVEEVGCPVGTTVLVEGLFYNTPARRKFLKKDATEAAACRAVVEKAALANPQVAFRFISEGETKLSTDGSGSLPAVIADVMGEERARGLLTLNGQAEQVEVTGYVSAPSAAVGRNTAQNTFVNGRYVVSKTVQAALKEAFKSYLPHDRYPVSIIFINVPPRFVDVNVHPAKTEIKFANERLLYEAVYYAVRTALERQDAFTGKEDDIFFTGGDVRLPNPRPSSEGGKGSAPTGGRHYGDYSPEDRSRLPQRTVIEAAKEPERTAFDPAAYGAEDAGAQLGDEKVLPLARGSVKDLLAAGEGEGTLPTPSATPAAPATSAAPAPTLFADGEGDAPCYRYVGELYDAYIIAETAEAFYIIDKHAAHERILYEELKHSTTAQSQSLLVGEVVELSPTETATVLENREYLASFGFDLDPFGDNSVVLRAVPVTVKPEGCGPLLQSFAAAMESGYALPVEERCDRALFTVACKAALKAGRHNDPAHNEWILQKLFADGSIKYCPHGRPVAKAFTRREADKWFDR